MVCCSLLSVVVCCVLLCVFYMLLDVCGLFVVGCLFDVRCLLFEAGCYLLCVVCCCSLFVVRC